MKMIVRAVPKFCLILTHAQVKAIVKTANMHYSMDCKMAASVGGFIYGWLNMTAPVAGEESASPIECTGTFREMDLLLKVLEFLDPSLCSQEKGWLDDLRDLVRLSMQASCTDIGNFVCHVEELPPEQRGPFHKFGLAQIQRP